MNHINNFGKYTVGTVVVLFIIFSAIGDYIALGLVSSVFVRMVFLLLFIVPLLTAWKGYLHSLGEAQKQETKKKAWTFFLIGVLFSIVLSCTISYVLGYILGII